MALPATVPVQELVEKAASPVSIQRAPPYLTRQPLYILNPTLLTAAQWRDTAKEPFTRLCIRHIIRELVALEWEVVPTDPLAQSGYVRYYEAVLAQADDEDGWDAFLSRMLQDALELPIGGNAELAPDPVAGGLLGGLYHIDGATLYPTYDRQIPFVQINPYNGLDRVYFGRGDLMRLQLQPRVDLIRKQYQEAPVESAFLAIEAMSRIYVYYLKQLGDTPMVGILDLMDMTAGEAADWAVNFREMLEGIDPLKIPVLYDHTKPARFLPFTRSPQDLSLVEQFKRFAELISSAFGLSIGDLRVFEHERVLAGVEASQRVTARSGIGFYAQAIEDMLNTRVLFTARSGLRFRFKLGLTGEDQAAAQLNLTRAQMLTTLVGPTTPVLKPEDAQKQIEAWGMMDVKLTGVPAAPGLEGLGGLLGGAEGTAPAEAGPEAGSAEESLATINQAAEEMGRFLPPGAPVALRKHFPGQHDQLDHGRKRKKIAAVEAVSSGQNYGAVAEALENWVAANAALGYAEEGVDPASELARTNALGFLRGAQRLIEGGNGELLLDESGVAQAFYGYTRHYDPEALSERPVRAEFRRYGYSFDLPLDPGGRDVVLQYLGVAPWHLTRNGVRGWGAAVMYKAFSRVLALEAEQVFLLSATPQSSAFYEKIGMFGGDEDENGQRAFAWDAEGMRDYIRQYEAEYLEPAAPAPAPQEVALVAG